MINNDKFKAVSEKKQIIHYPGKKLFSSKTPFPTKIYYQYGEIEGEKFIKFYIGDQVVSLRKQKEHSNIYLQMLAAFGMGEFVILKNNGGQSLEQAREQREKTLKYIVLEIFHALNYQEVKERLIYSYKPDLVLEKDDHLLIIELKAFHEDTIVADPQIGQVMKYAAAAADMDDDRKKRLLLITSGELIPISESWFQVDELDADKFAEKEYGQLLKNIKNPTFLDDWERKLMYESFLVNFWKKVTSFRESDEAKKQVQMMIREILTINDFQSFIDMNTKILVGFISTLGIKQLLNHLNNSELGKLLIKLRETRLENLIIDKNILYVGEM